MSRATVSRVMNDVPGATEAVRHRVRTVIAELGYVPDQAARALASRRQPAIDVVVAAPLSQVGWVGAHPYYSRVLACVPAALAVRFQRRCRRVVLLVQTAASVPAVEADNASGSSSCAATGRTASPGRTCYRTAPPCGP